MASGTALALSIVPSVTTVWLIVLYRDRIADLTGLVDDASKKPHASHGGRVPLVGGLAWLAGIYVFAGCFAILSVFSGGLGALAPFYPLVLCFLAFMGLFFSLGLVDDLNGLTPRARLAASVVFVAALMSFTGDTFLLTGVSDVFLSINVDFGYLSFVATALAVVAFVNAVNMADGRNGVVAGITAIWSMTLLIQSGNGYLSGVLAASFVNCLVLWWSNARGRLFFGDAGSYVIAAAFAGTTIFWHSEGFGGAVLTSLQVCAMFMILVIDMLRLIFDRMRAGRSPMAPDHNHLHHRLDYRFGWKVGLPIYLALVGLPIVVAFQPFDAAGAIGIVLGLVAYSGMISFTDPARRQGAVAPDIPRDKVPL